ncbi:hypothetical protein XA67_20235 [Comamonas thiooxydans]|uniref:tetratricopeptide repeat protein n=1 Tax=Comamonas thiooxydans TaxID=363952 RepID=UPI0006223D35|nr:SEL1-like repeat protein [Comamonas thiooxydans]KKI12315.1 hypothetical protein XA67_20235 [Comamonas thiooxydans]
MTDLISIDTVAIITERSKRTWQRRLASGVDRVLEDLRGRSMLRLEDIHPFICAPLSKDDINVLIQADRGSASCQCDIGQVFDLLGKHEIAIYWWMQAAEQGDAEAMQCLGSAYAAGRGVSEDENLALMWIARAAAQGHSIARTQISRLLPFSS